MSNGYSGLRAGVGRRAVKALCYSLLYIHICTPVLHAQDVEDEKPVKKPSKHTEQSHIPGTPLQVPVVPKAIMRKPEEIKNEKEFFKALGNNYILMEDGSVLSAADWMLGALRKDRSGHLMDDYERRLFLGQAARAALGLDETLVHNSLTDSGPLVSYDARPTISKPTQILEGIYRYFVPGRNKNYRPEVSGGAFHPLAKTGGTGPYLFEKQFNESIMWTAQEFKDHGTFQIMLRDAQKKLEKQ
ncbi:hypothetical protein KFE96_13565 [Kordiimonas sp. SCSIO 12603]|uniref:hypothetical protein n=1 Tax=Kordiimonas sp. SCSIO 12603 TaxID=2829596 RepID=UPI0021043DC3|nr:hypothetical protein [Kordiimonas sp. SCSIO 12603]UTW57846.1 hypothetical protein KFE96_13565 [Kordiimonas sp. SCSIO 12603]